MQVTYLSEHNIAYASHQFNMAAVFYMLTRWPIFCYEPLELGAGYLPLLQNDVLGYEVSNGLDSHESSPEGGYDVLYIFPF